ncbi:MAG: Spy/CpxP family protein refolding chaperone [Kovacikia sp.]
MKSQSVMKFVASMLLIPATGFAIINSAAHFSPAFADSLSSSTSILAQDAPVQSPTEKKEWGNRGQKMYQQLNLSADQQAQIESIKEQAKTSNQGLRQQLKTAREQLKTLLASNDASDSALRQAHQQLQPLTQQMSDQRFDTMLKIRNVLTPAQRTKLAELRKQGGHRHHRQAPAAQGAAS